MLQMVYGIMPLEIIFYLEDKIYIADDYYDGVAGQGAIYVFDMDGNFERTNTIKSTRSDY